MKLSLRAIARSRDGAVHLTGPVMRHRVAFDPPMDGHEAFIENLSASTPRWEVRLSVDGVPQDVPGECQSAEEALALLQKKLEE